MLFFSRWIWCGVTAFALVAEAAEPFDVANESEMPFSEAQIFEWWDDGLIDGEEAAELLDKLQEENAEEACHLAAALALETCIPPKKPAKKEKIANHKTLSTHGYVTYRTRLDSAGREEQTQLDASVSFYRLELHLGSRNLLSYKHKGAKAYFGEISTRELHSQFSADTLWGVALFYPVGKFRLQGVLDTALNLQGALGFVRRGLTASSFVWYHKQSPDATDQSPKDSIPHTVLEKSPQTVSVGLQLKIPEGEIAGWWQQGQNRPLVKMQIHKTVKIAGSPSTNSATIGSNISEQNRRAVVSWQTSAVYHGAENPEQAHLSNTLLKNKFTGTQSITVTLPRAAPRATSPLPREINLRDNPNANKPQPTRNTSAGTSTSSAFFGWQTQFSFNARVFIPLESDSLKARFKLSAETGPEILRTKANFTCLEAATHCLQKDVQLQMNALFSDFTLGVSIKSRHTRDQGFSAPKSEGSLTYHPHPLFHSKLTLAIPKGSPQKSTLIRNETTLTVGIFQGSLTATFRRDRGKNTRPIHGLLQAKCFF